MEKEELSQVKVCVEDAVKNGINETTIRLIKEFGEYLTKDDKRYDKRLNKEVIAREKLKTNQIRRFFGEVKRQQLTDYKPTSFILLKPKLAYAVGRASRGSKIEDFYEVLSVAIDTVVSEEKNGNKDAFKNFIAIFESIVAYHKYAEAGNTQK